MYHFVQFHFYSVMTLVVPCLDNIYMYGFADLWTCKNWCTKPIHLDSGSPRRGGGVRVCYHCIVHILNSRKSSVFFVSNSDLCRAMLPNYLRTYSSALCQIRALKKAFKKQNNGQSIPTILVLNACIWLARTNTQKLHAILHVFCL